MTLAQFDRPLIRRFKRAAHLVSLLTLVIGGLVLLGWLLNLPLLKSILPVWVTMKPNTALGFLLSGFTLQRLQSRQRWQRRLALGSALLVLGLGSLTLSEYLLNQNWGIDQALFAEDAVAIATSHPGRMSPVTAFNFALGGAALSLASLTKGPYRLGQLLTLLIMLTSLQVLIGYSYGIQPLFGLASFTDTAIHTAVTFLLVSVGVLLATPTQGWMSLVVSKTAGGIAARILLPAAVIVPAGLGWLQVLGEGLGWYDEAFGRSLQVIGNVLVFLGLTGYCTQRLYRVDLQRWRAEAALRAAYDVLDLRVTQRTAELSLANQTLEQEIQERRWAETALQESQALLQAIIDNVPAVVYLKDLAGRYLLINQWFETLFGLSPEQVLGQRDVDLLPSEQAETFQSSDRQVLLSGEAIKVEETIRLGDELHTYLSVKFPLYDANHSLYGLGGISTEITELRQVELALRQSEARFRRAILEAPLPMMLHAEGGEVLQINHAWTETTGFTPEDMPTIAAWTARAYGDRQAEMQAAIANLYQLEHRAAFGEHPVRTRTGETRIWDFYAAPLGRLPDGRKMMITTAIDVTVRKQAEQQLAEQAALMQRQANLLELTYEAIFVRDERGAITYWNRGAELMYGWSRQEAIGHVTHTLLQTQLPDPEGDLDQLVLQQEHWQGELVHTRKTGQQIIVASRQAVIRNAQGQPTGFLEVNRDITKRKRIEQEQQRLAAIVENSPNFIATATLEGKLLYLNPAGRELVGLDPQAPLTDLYGTAFYPPEYEDQLVNQVAPAVLEQGHWEGELLLRHFQTGELIPVYQLVFVSRDRATGQPFSLATVALDIRERKRVEEALRASEQRFRSTFEQAAVGIAHVGLDGQWLMVNQKLCDMVGYSHTELLQKTFQDITYPPDLVLDLEYVEQLLAGELDTYSMEKRYVCKNGSLIWINLTGAIVRRSDGAPDYFISVIQEITDRKAAEEAIQQLNTTLEQRVQERTAQLLEVNQELKRFSYTVSHDLRSPLRAIRGLIEALVEDYHHCLDEPGQEYAQAIAHAARRMDALIQDLLAYSNLSQTEIQLQAVDLNRLLPEVLSQVELEWQARHATIDVAFPLPPVLAQRTILTQVLVNLIDNAFKFVAAGVQPQVRIWAEQCGSGSQPLSAEARQGQMTQGFRGSESCVRLWVADNGIGIEPEYQARIFSVFERLHATDTYAGTGVGLAIVQKGMERMGGRVGVESQPGQGSRFWIELPLVEGAELDNSR